MFFLFFLKRRLPEYIFYAANILSIRTLLFTPRKDFPNIFIVLAWDILNLFDEH